MPQAASSDAGLAWWQRAACSVVSAGPLPRHVAFIMDGNRRWARNRGLPVAEGHRRGYAKLEESLRWCAELGVAAVTCYAFSLENFKRSAEEVDTLMALMGEKLRSMRREDSLIMTQRVRVRVVGNLARVPADVRAEIDAVTRLTSAHERAVLTVCFAYTSREEVSRGGVSDVRPPHAAGEKRLSDFLVWQSAAAVTLFTPVRWPDLSLLRFLGRLLPANCVLLRYQAAKPHLDAALGTGERDEAGAGAGGVGAGAGAGAKAGVAARQRLALCALSAAATLLLGALAAGGRGAPDGTAAGTTAGAGGGQPVVAAFAVSALAAAAVAVAVQKAAVSALEM
ncbi:hypothetical protein EMIHUDRAFT_101820 [Emiliania huxleyi CCMP1516]|uniref:Alkyl transferase n=2 Tax=Emiliania huxleyi TaxID=2903 RepID=A0A0D3JAC8_EMIH1|nr:hypothetical protein EMIHUDRAFT_101820 [Emiliania huxleyi CCMP1516]EOD20463.1 hypothetical protein EMIHUDRAFT_101820 [Emiliania huxleyi CCMP1516]|eukprot:XP_005772892.1 hypothetical protein EMIHUDRAFT_101820 [Emiliania huxleyi CCMP1516]